MRNSYRVELEIKMADVKPERLVSWVAGLHTCYQRNFGGYLHILGVQQRGVTSFNTLRRRVTDNSKVAVGKRKYISACKHDGVNVMSTSTPHYSSNTVELV